MIYPSLTYPTTQPAATGNRHRARTQHSFAGGETPVPQRAASVVDLMGYRTIIKPAAIGAVDELTVAGRAKRP